MIVNIDIFCDSYTIEGVSDKDIKFIWAFCATLRIRRSSSVVTDKIKFANEKEVL